MEEKNIGKKTSLVRKFFKIGIVKRIFFPIYKKMVLDPIYKKRNKVFLENGLETLTVFHQCMEKYNHPYTLMFGSLLGAIREHGFIKHDLDIDTCVWWDDYSPDIENHLKEFGFEIADVTLIDDGNTGRHESYRYKGVTLDIFYIYPAVDKLPFTCDYGKQPGCSSREQCVALYGGVLPRRIELPFTRERELVDFMGIKVYIPTNAHELMRCRYGENYMIPNPDKNSSYVYPVEWPEKLGVITIYEE